MNMNFMKKILIAGIIVSSVTFSNSAFAVTKIEHLNDTDNSKTSIVKITDKKAVVEKENMIKIGFSENFNSKYYRKGDMVEFGFSEDIKTEEGTVLIPKGSNLIAAITDIQKPKSFSRNAKIELEFLYILLPNGDRLSLNAELANGKGYLSGGAKATAAKIAAYTVGVGGVGAGMGAWIGTASSNVIPGLIIGSSIGGGVGLITGVVTPGVHYRAKKGKLIPIRFEEDLIIPKTVPNL